jgi:hypothetical protein
MLVEEKNMAQYTLTDDNLEPTREYVSASLAECRNVRDSKGKLVDPDPVRNYELSRVVELLSAPPDLPCSIAIADWLADELKAI